jgi:hypothetical protein
MLATALLLTLNGVSYAISLSIMAILFNNPYGPLMMVSSTSYAMLLLVRVFYTLLLDIQL